MTFFYDLNKKLSDLAAKPQPQTLNEGSEPVYEKYMGFEKLEKEIGKRGDVRDPGAVAASIGRKKYGKAAFQKAAAAGRKMGEGQGFKATGGQGIKPTGDLKHGMPMRLNTGSGSTVHAPKPVGVNEEPNEGNEFSGELAKAKASGAKEFEVDDKTYPVKEAAKKEKAAWPGTPEYREKTGTETRADFRKKHAGSVMKDPKARQELEKLDTEYEAGKGRYGKEEEPDDEEGKKQAKPAGEKRGRGRPKGTKRAIGAKGPTGRSKLMTREDYDRDEYDEEGEMAQSQARTIEDAAQELQSILDADENLPEWVQKKITLAKEYIDSARDYLKANPPEEQGMMAEKAVSKAQRAAAGIAYAAKKGDIPKSELRGASKEMAQMPAGELKKFAKTKEKGLPEKVREVDTGEADARRTAPSSKKHNDEVFARHRERANKEREDHGKESDEKSVKETTTAGSVATAPAEGGKKSKGGVQFGKGIYDSMNRELESMIAESMNVSINMNTDAHGGPSKSVTVTATDEDAEKLAGLLKMAGLGGGGGYSGMACSKCGERDCGCDQQVDENKPDWPTNTETSADALQYSGGLNKPKATGQTTVPVIASQDDRQHAYESSEADEIRRLREMAGILPEAKRPDFPDIDDDGNRTEPIAKAAKDKKQNEEKQVAEALQGSLWNLYKRLG
jgi:hypothetical protein